MCFYCKKWSFIYFYFIFLKESFAQHKRIQPIKILYFFKGHIFECFWLYFLSKNCFVLAGDCLEIRNVWPISKCDWVTLQVANSITPLNSFGQKSDDHSWCTCWQCNPLYIFVLYLLQSTCTNRLKSILQIRQMSDKIVFQCASLLCIQSVSIFNIIKFCRCWNSCFCVEQDRRNKIYDPWNDLSEQMLTVWVRQLTREIEHKVYLGRSLYPDVLHIWKFKFIVTAKCEG